MAVDGNRLSLLEHLAEALGKCLRCFAYHLPAEDVTYRILHHFRLFFTVVTVQLGEVLETEADRYFITSCGGNKVVQASEIDGG